MNTIRHMEGFARFTLVSDGNPHGTRVFVEGKEVCVKSVTWSTDGRLPLAVLTVANVALAFAAPYVAAAPHCDSADAWT